MKRSLLIIDDYKPVRDSLRFLFERRGFDAVVAASGAEGIALARQQVFDGAMIDVNMPGMDGISVCRILQADARETGRKFAVWMMTGARTPQLTKAAIEAGALTLLAKPFDFEDLFRQFAVEFGDLPSDAPAPLAGSADPGAPAARPTLA